MFGLGGKIVRTAEIRDPTLRAAAELIDENVGFERDHEVTERDLKKMTFRLAEHRALVATGAREDSPLRGLRDLEVDAVERALPELASRVHARKERGDAPFATAVAVSAIVDPEIRACAALVAQSFGASTGEGDGDLSFTELTDAKSALARLESGELEKTSPALAERLSAAPCFNAKNLGDIELFMTSGKGGLVSMGEVEIAGIRFQDAYLLAAPPGGVNGALQAQAKAKTTSRKTNKTAASEIEVPTSERALSRPTAHAAADKLPTRRPTKEPDPVEVAELMMQNCRFDRVYVYRDDGARVVLRHDKGGLDKLQPGFRVKLPGDHTGTVIRVVDLNNSARETVLGFWGKVARNTTSLVRGKFVGELDRKLDGEMLEVADEVGDVGRAAKPKTRPDLKGMVATVVGAAGLSGTLAAGGAVAAPFLGIPAVIGGSVGLVAGVTGANLLEARLRKQDLTPLYHAIGVAVNRRQDVIY